MKKPHLLSALRIQFAACSAEVGSEKWRQELKAKPKGDCSANQARD